MDKVAGTQRVRFAAVETASVYTATAHAVCLRWFEVQLCWEVCDRLHKRAGPIDLTVIKQWAI